MPGRIRHIIYITAQWKWPLSECAWRQVGSYFPPHYILVFVFSALRNVRTCQRKMIYSWLNHIRIYLRNEFKLTECFLGSSEFDDMLTRLQFLTEITDFRTKGCYHILILWGNFIINIRSRRFSFSMAHNVRRKLQFFWNITLFS
jgi:hypothetical protein